ncbi:MAG: rod shape-determining protein MreC [Frankiales bacterium]|jgi:rod shape-determining protein MreC|nr:rod shape-determining protein MreC [Frankiales bacterium]
MNREPRRQRTYFILLLVTAFALLTIDYHSNGTNSPLHPLEKLVAGVTGPGEKAVNSLVKPITDQVHFGKQPSQVAELQKELDAAKALAETSQNDHRQVEQFDKLLGWPPYYVMKMKPARVVGTGDTLSNDGSVTIDMGTRDGVHINMTVVTGLGLIGNVIRVQATTSTVQLLTDPTIYVTVKNGRTNVGGFVSGRTDGNLDLTQISQTSDIRAKDQLVTLGSEDNQPYVPNVPVGEVIKVDNTPGAATHTAIVRPYASFNALDIVAVIFAPATPFPHVFISPITPPPTTAPPSPTVTPARTSGSVSPSALVSGTSATTTTASRATQTSAPTTTHPATTTSAPQTSAVPTTTHATTKPTTTKPPTTKPPTTKPTTKPPTSGPPTSTSAPHTTPTP